MITAELKQARKGIQEIIKKNKLIIVITRKDDPDNPFSTSTDYTIRCRLSHDKLQPQMLTEAPSGYTSNIFRYILCDHQQTIQKDDVFEAIGQTFKIGQIDPLYAFGGITGYQAPLQEAVTIGDDS